MSGREPTAGFTSDVLVFVQDLERARTLAGWLASAGIRARAVPDATTLWRVVGRGKVKALVLDQSHDGTVDIARRMRAADATARVGLVLLATPGAPAPSRWMIDYVLEPPLERAKLADTVRAVMRDYAPPS